MRLHPALVCLLLPWVLAAHAETRVALVIGNGAYVHADRLTNPRNDAEAVAAALQRSGFATIIGTDLDKSGMEEATIRFARSARDADVAMFYYSGHALQFAGVNYLMPIDARLTDEADLRRMLRVDEVVALLQQARNLRILVLDACRDNPLAEELRRSIGQARSASVQRGLARIDSPQGMIVAYATQSGRTADDGRGRNSPYTAAFLEHIEEKEEIGTIFRRVGAEVYEATGRKQLPELSLSLIGEYYLNGRQVAAAPADAARGGIPISFLIDGHLVERPVDVGAVVRKGDLLARLDSRVGAAEVATLEAQLRALQTAVDQATAQEARDRKLLAGGGVSRQQHEQSKGALQQVRTKLSDLQARLAYAREQLSYSQLRAGFDGVVTAVGVDVGMLVRAGQMVVEVNRQFIPTPPAGSTAK